MSKIRKYELVIDGNKCDFYTQKVSIAFIRKVCKIDSNKEVWAYVQDSNMLMKRMFNEDIVDLDKINKFRALDNEE